MWTSGLKKINNDMAKIYVELKLSAPKIKTFMYVFDYVCFWDYSVEKKIIYIWYVTR